MELHCKAEAFPDVITVSGDVSDASRLKEVEAAGAELVFLDDKHCLSQPGGVRTGGLPEVRGPF